MLRSLCCNKVAVEEPVKRSNVDSDIAVQMILEPENWPLSEPRVKKFYDFKAKLVARELITRQRSVPLWSGILQKRPFLHRTFSFPDYKNAIYFINQISEESHISGHYPKIINLNTKVGVTLRTTLVDGLTEQDFALAEEIDQIFNKLL